MDTTFIDLSAKSGQFIADNSEIPPDIIFKFAEAGGVYAKIAAHKMILAMVSQVFRNMFYVHDTRDRSANEIVIEGSTKQPFQIMIDAVYHIKPINTSLQGKSVDEIFAVLHLVTMYEIPELVLAVKESLSSFPITEENVMEVADTAMEYMSTFEEAAQCLLLSCAKLLKETLTDAESFNEFVAENGDRMSTVHKLAVLMKDLPPTPTCYGCMKKSRKIFLQRDYSEGSGVRFQTRFPAELEGKLDRQAFEYTIKTLNSLYDEAEKASCSTDCEGCMACLTAYIIDFFTETHYEKCLKKVSRFVHEQNH